MSTKNLARAISQGGHDASYNHRIRRANRQTRQEEKRFIRALLSDETSDAQIDVPPVSWGYAGKKSTGSAGPLRRWLDGMVGHDLEEAYHRLCRFDRRTREGRRVIRMAEAIIEDATDHTSLVTYDDVVVDENGTLRAGSDFACETDPRPRPYVRWPIRRNRRVIERCGDLFFRVNGALVPFTDEQTEDYHRLSGSNQRALKGYHRSMDGKRRKNRRLPWQTRRRERQLALGRAVD